MSAQAAKEVALGDRSTHYVLVPDDSLPEAVPTSHRGHAFAAFTVRPRFFGIDCEQLWWRNQHWMSYPARADVANQSTKRHPLQDSNAHIGRNEIFRHSLGRRCLRGDPLSHALHCLRPALMVAAFRPHVHAVTCKFA